MPLKRFFHSARRVRRSKSQHGGKHSTQNNEVSTQSLDESQFKGVIICAEGQKNGVGAATKPKPPHPTRPVHWSSAHDLIPEQPTTLNKTLVKVTLAPKSSKPITESPKRRLGPTVSIGSTPKLTNPVTSPTLSRKKSHSTVRKKLSHFEDLSRLEFSADGYRLTGQQRELLKSCWRQATNRQGDAAHFVFNWVFSRHPQLKQVFGIENLESPSKDPGFQKHLQAFTEVFELVIASVVDEAEEGGGTMGVLSLDDTTGPLLHLYGARHAKIEAERCDDDEDLIRPEHWDIFRTAMCEYASSAWRQNVLSALSVSSSAQKRNEALHAWRILVYYIIAKVKQGYEIEKNEQRKRGRGRSVAE